MQLLKGCYGYMVAQIYYEESSLGIGNVKLRRVMELGIVLFWVRIMFVSLTCGQL